MKYLIAMTLAFSLVIYGGCKSNSENDSEKGPEGSERGEKGGPDEGDDRPMPWPPPGDKAPPPPGVRTAMAAIATAINAGDHEKAKVLFLNRAQFLGVSDCEPKTVVDRVLEGRNNVVERIKGGKQTALFKEFTEGYLLNIKRGEKPAECRAKVDIKLYQTRYVWELNGSVQKGEAHFLEVGGTWFFVKL